MKIWLKNWMNSIASRSGMTYQKRRKKKIQLAFPRIGSEGAFPRISSTDRACGFRKGQK